MSMSDQEALEDRFLEAAVALEESGGVGAVHSILAEWKHGDELAELFKNQDDYDELEELRKESEKRADDAEVIRDALRHLSWGEVDKAAEVLGDLIEDRPIAPSSLLRIRGHRRLANLFSRMG